MLLVSLISFCAFFWSFQKSGASIILLFSAICSRLDARSKRVAKLLHFSLAAGSALFHFVKFHLVSFLRIGLLFGRLILRFLRTDGDIHTEGNNFLGNGLGHILEELIAFFNIGLQRVLGGIAS